MNYISLLSPTEIDSGLPAAVEYGVANRQDRWHRAGALRLRVASSLSSRRFGPALQWQGVPSTSPLDILASFL